MQLPPSISRSWFSMAGFLKLFTDDSTAAQPARPTIGLALSHGAARGLAHIGVIQVLEEENIPISVIAGSSMGAYVGALWASGIQGAGLAKLAAEIKDRRTLLRLLDPIFPPVSGIVKGHKIRKHLGRTLGELNTEQLQRKLLVVATNLDTGKGEILRNVPLAEAVHASCAIPGICAPVTIGGSHYIDGGAAEPLPVRLLKRVEKVDYVIGVNVMPTSEDLQRCELDGFPIPPKPASGIWRRLIRGLNQSINLFAYGNVLDTYMRCLYAAQMHILDEDAAQADVLLHPYFCESKWYDFENFDRYIIAGRDAAKAALPQIRALLKSHPKSLNHETVPLITPVGCRDPRVLAPLAVSPAA